ncbi:MAG: hypothetical protein JW955_09685 [Sedimentisphaerales bacterium]|nr:hypothetical protein [Sedimentisphaerales bacterium]
MGGLIVALSIGGVALSLVSTSRYGVGVSSDSTAYLSAARSLSAGHGYMCHDGSPYTGWPPLFPTVLAGIGLAGIDPAVAARFLNAFAFGGIIFASGLFFVRCLKSKALVVVATSSILLSYPLLDISIMALTEAVFVLLVVLFVLEISSLLECGRFFSLVLASVFASLCLLQRYTGVTLVLAGTILIVFFERHGRPSVRLKHLAWFLAISCAPMAVWVVRNVLTTHMLTGHTRHHSVHSLYDNVVFAADAATKWLVPEWVSLSMRLIIVTLLLLLATAVLVFSLKVRRSVDGDCPYIRPAGVVMLVYVPLLLYTHQVGVLNEPINDRYLSPLAALVPWVLFAAVDRVRAWLSPRLRPASVLVVGLCALWLLYPLGRIREQVSSHRKYGAGGYAWVGWQTSPLVSWLHEHPLQGSVRCNAPDALYALVGRSAAVSPHRTWNMPEFARMLFSGPGEFLVWFSRLPQPYLYDLDELVSVLNVEELIAFSDGGVYRLLPSSDGAFFGSRVFSSCMVDGKWNRSFTSDPSGPGGRITSWILRADGTMDSTWQLSTAQGAPIRWRASGSYVRSDEAFEARCEGQAVRDADGTDSSCAMDVQGTVDGDTAAGTYRVEFADPQWPATVSGAWQVDLARPVYRLYSSQRQKHLYTVSKEEVTRLTNLLLDRWACEGVAFYAYPQVPRRPEARPVYGLKSVVHDSQFLTMNEAEKHALVSGYGDAWSDAGIAFHAFSEDSYPYTARPVHRFWSAATDDHLYTTSEAERDTLTRDFPHVWMYEGIAWYAIPGDSPR